MRMITISREFGSGGRELGKRMADELGFDYYDKEIITAIASHSGMDENYVDWALDQHGWQNIPLTFRNSFSSVSIQSAQTGLLLEQKRVIEDIAKAGKDCIIVGRNADVLLRDYHPFNLFVCADMDARIHRCMSRAPEGEDLTEKEMERKIRNIDRSRSHTRDIISSSRWGERTAYHLTVNTTDWSIKELTPVVSAFVKCWFDREIK